jgi:hypothetical protein
LREQDRLTPEQEAFAEWLLDAGEIRSDLNERSMDERSLNGSEMTPGLDFAV